ncbi:hypothetical protein KY285_013119 [Solanum tuberosum]|nr:hypothetical protein KY285_013119 [Solanum tuberosum]
MPITHIGKMLFVPHHSSRQVELQNATMFQHQHGGTTKSPCQIQGNWSKSYNINLKKKDKEGRLNKNKRVHETPELLQEKVQKDLQPQLRRKTRLKCSNAKYIDATLAEMVNNKDATTFEEASTSRDQNNPMKEEILKGHGRHDACRARIAHNGRKEKIKLVLRGSVKNSSPI